MEPLHIEATADTPLVDFNPQNGLLTLSEKSLPENAVAFYSPVINWLMKYLQTAPEKLTLNFKLDYFNSASSKKLIEILQKLSSAKQKTEIQINWYYKSIDEDMLSVGEEFQYISELKFNYYEIDPDQDEIDIEKTIEDENQESTFNIKRFLEKVMGRKNS